MPPIVDFLLARSMAVYPVNPSSMDQYRKSQKVSGSKSDSADAQLIADYPEKASGQAWRLHHQNLRAWQVSEPHLRELQLLVTDRDKLVKEKVRLQNQLRSTLRGYYPSALKAFSDISCPTALDFLSRFPNHLALEDQSQQDWTSFLEAHRVFNPKVQQNFLSAINHPSIEADSAVVFRST